MIFKRDKILEYLSVIKEASIQIENRISKGDLE